MWPIEPGAMCQRRKKKKDAKRGLEKSLIHSCRCVTLLLPQQRFTVELMTKGQAPCSLLWPGTIWRLWMANPFGPLTGRAFKRPGGLISLPGLGPTLWQGWENPGHLHLQRLSLSPEHIVKGKILSLLSLPELLCNARGWTRGVCHQRAKWKSSHFSWP